MKPYVNLECCTLFSARDILVIPFDAPVSTPRDPWACHLRLTCLAISVPWPRSLLLRKTLEPNDRTCRIGRTAMTMPGATSSVRAPSSDALCY